MKVITREIPKFQEDDYFSPVRSKRDYVKLIVISARYLLLNFDTSTLACESKIKLLIDKMSRLFYFKDGKYFSVAFPFLVTLEEDQVQELSTYQGKKVDSEALSKMIEVLDDPAFKIKHSLIDYFYESDFVSQYTIELLEELFRSESSYLRYDYDFENMNGKLHPLNHLDINYSNYGTYKLGLNDTISTTTFEDIININTDCSFLTD